MCDASCVTGVRNESPLRDFYGGDGEAGYFQQELQVYDREDEPCRRCGRPVAAFILGQRATYYCKNCQR